MAFRKGQGRKKGKQPAEKAPAKRPAAPVISLDEEEETFHKQAILAQIALIEKAQGLSPGGPHYDCDYHTRHASQCHFQTQLLNRLSLLTAQVQATQGSQVESSSGVSPAKADVTSGSMALHEMAALLPSGVAVVGDGKAHTAEGSDYFWQWGVWGSAISPASPG